MKKKDTVMKETEMIVDSVVVHLENNKIFSHRANYFYSDESCVYICLLADDRVDIDEIIIKARDIVVLYPIRLIQRIYKTYKTI
jgi:hypothetical protein